ncbi:hypothetical protein DPMN_124865, partial [Dreissena polymorpha]
YRTSERLVTEPDAPGNLKPTLTLNLHEELYVISSSDSQRALGKYEAIVRALFTTTIVILASLI